MNIDNILLKDKINKIQEPIQYQIMALLAVLKSQEQYFETKELYNIYLDCFKTQLNKDFEKLKEQEE